MLLIADALVTTKIRLLFDAVRLRFDVERQTNRRGIVVARIPKNTVPTLVEICDRELRS